MTDRVSAAALVVGVLALAAAGGLYVTREHHVPPVINVQPAPVTVQQAPAPVVNVQTPEPKPYVCTPQQAEAGECLPILPKGDKTVPIPKPRDILTTQDGRRVTDITVDMHKDKMKAQKKKKRADAKKKLQRDWSRAQSNFPQIFSGWK